jgi:hypothetical protein
MLNAGQIRNKGIELLVGGTPLRFENGQLGRDLNYSKNNNTVEELYGDLETIVLDTYYGVQVEARSASRTARCTAASTCVTARAIVVGSNGLPLNVTVTGEPRTSGLLGNYNPDFNWGVTTACATVRGIELSFLHRHPARRLDLLADQRLRHRVPACSATRCSAARRRTRTGAPSRQPTAAA